MRLLSFLTGTRLGDETDPEAHVLDASEDTDDVPMPVDDLYDSVERHDLRGN